MDVSYDRPDVGGGAGSVIYRPGEPSPSGNVFNTLAAASAAGRPGSTLIIDMTAGGIAVALADTAYDFSNFVGFRGVGPGPILVLQEGATGIIARTVWFQNIGLQLIGTSAFFALTEDTTLVLQNTSSLQADSPGTRALLNITDGAHSVYLESGSYIYAAGAQRVIKATAPATVLITVSNGCALYDDSLTGTGSFNVLTVATGITGVGMPLVSETQAGATDISFTP